MRTPSSALLVVALAASPAFAEDNVAGTYDVKIEETASTCDPKPETLSKGKVTIAVKKTSLSVKFDALYQMVGVPAKNGNVSAKTTKLIGTSVGGLSARYSVVGRVDGDTLGLALTAQYVRQDSNKPYCSQVWNVTGSRIAADKKTTHAHLDRDEPARMVDVRCPDACPYTSPCP